MRPSCRRNYMASCTQCWLRKQSSVCWIKKIIWPAFGLFSLFNALLPFCPMLRCCAVDWLTLWDSLSRPQMAGKARAPNTSDGNASRWPTSPSCWSAKFASDGFLISQIPAVNHGMFIVIVHVVKISIFPYVKTPPPRQVGFPSMPQRWKAPLRRQKLNGNFWRSDWSSFRS